MAKVRREMFPDIRWYNIGFLFPFTILVLSPFCLGGDGKGFKGWKLKQTIQEEMNNERG